MNEAELADFRRLIGDKAFLAFLYRMIQTAGVFAVPPADADPRFFEGRRSLALELLAEAEAAQDKPSADGMPVTISIQIFQAVAQLTAKEKTLGRRSDPYRDLGDGDDATGS